MAEYTYAGVSYTYAIEEDTFFSARVAEKEEPVAYGELGAVTHAVKVLTPVEPYRQTPASQVPLRVQRFLREMAEEESRKQVEEAAKREAERAQRKADEQLRLGAGNYQCPQCGHRQSSDGVCEYCGDALVS